MKGINIFLADGFEEVEALATYDVLKRAGLDVELVSVMDDPFVTSAHGVTIGTSSFLSILDLDSRDTTAEDVMIFPGGMPGAKNLAENKTLISALNDHHFAGGTVAAICAAPGLVLGQIDMWDMRYFTCYDGFESSPCIQNGIFTPKPVVTDGHVITGRGPGYAFDFALEIVRFLKGSKLAASIRHDLYLE